MIKHIIFDWDDTLSLTEEAGFYLENKIAKELGHNEMSREIHKQTWGKPLPEIIDTRIPGIDIKKFMELVGPTMRQLTLQGKFDYLTKDKLDLLENLKISGYSILILTSRTLSEVNHLLDSKHQLSKFVTPEYFYYKELSKYSKPDPRVFDKIKKDLNCSSKELLYIGDSPTDAVASKLAGMYFIASLESGLRAVSDFPENFVDGFVQKLSQLIDNENYLQTLTFNSPNNIPQIIKSFGLSVPHDYFKQS